MSVVLGEHDASPRASTVIIIVARLMFDVLVWAKEILTHVVRAYKSTSTIVINNLPRWCSCWDVEVWVRWELIHRLTRVFYFKFAHVIAFLDMSVMYSA